MKDIDDARSAWDDHMIEFIHGDGPDEEDRRQAELSLSDCELFWELECDVMENAK